jgi:hypothetical protein
LLLLLVELGDQLIHNIHPEGELLSTHSTADDTTAWRAVNCSAISLWPMATIYIPFDR